MDVKEATKEDIPEIVTVHLSAFPGFFLSALGKKFLKLYYQCVLKSTEGILLVCFDGKKLVGFCAATTRSAGFNTRLILNNFIKFVYVGTTLLFTKPRAIVRLAKNLTKKGATEDNGEYGELLSIGVSEIAQSKGIGKTLISQLERAMYRRGVCKLSLTTDVEENNKTLNFYSSNGYIKFYEFIAYPDRRMYRLMKDL